MANKSNTLQAERSIRQPFPSLMAVCRDCAGCPGSPGIYLVHARLGPLQACSKQAHARRAKPTLRRPSKVPAAPQPARARDAVHRHAGWKDRHTLAFTFTASQVTVQPRLAATARTAVQNGWWISKTTRAHFPVLRADTKHRGAGRLETSDPAPPASPRAAVRPR